MLNPALRLDGEAMPSRQRIERIIDNLIALLDESDQDPDDEPSLGWCNPVEYRGFTAGGSDDREECCDFEPDVDMEENTTPQMDDRGLYFGEIR